MKVYSSLPTIVQVVTLTGVPLTPIEIQTLARASWSSQQPDRDEALIWVLASGVKVVEAIAANWSDYNGQGLVVGGKVMDLRGEAIESLNNYWKLRNCAIDEPIFISESHLSKGQRISVEGVRGILKWIGELTEIDTKNNRFRIKYLKN